MEPRVFEGAVRALQRLANYCVGDGTRYSRNERRQTFCRCESVR